MVSTAERALQKGRVKKAVPEMSNCLTITSFVLGTADGKKGHVATLFKCIKDIIVYLRHHSLSVHAVVVCDTDFEMFLKAGYQTVYFICKPVDTVVCYRLDPS